MYKRRKFSIRYRIEKWFFEDSREDFRKFGFFLCEFLVLAIMFAVIFIVPAFFH